MKLRITLKAVTAAAIVIAVIAFAPLFPACDTFWFTEEKEMELLSVKIGGLEITTIPSPITSEDWDDEEYDVAVSGFGLVIVKKDADMEGQAITAEATPGATVTWGLAKGGTRPARFNDLRQPVTFERSDFFFFRVFDPERKETKYYRFYPKDASPVKELAALAIAGRDADKVPQETDSPATLATQVSGNYFRGTVYITRGEALKGAIVAATPQDETARIRYAVAASLQAAQREEFSEWEDAERVVVQDEQNKDIPQNHDVMTFTDGNILMVEVKAQNDIANYYGFMVYTERMATVATLKFDGNIVAGKGTEHPIWLNVMPGSYSSADQSIAGFNIAIELEDSEGTADWGVINAVNAGGQPSYTFGLNPTVHFNNKQALVIRVHSPRDTESDIRFYKIQVILKAANFARHPKSDAYEILSHTYPLANAPGEKWDGRILTTAQGTRTLDREPVALTFLLDRVGTFQYQWYTANSWYGGYGFDQDSNIAYDPDVQEQRGDVTVPPTNNPKYDPFVNDCLDIDYFPEPAVPDEKGNISFHNGGNEYYRLPYMGIPISGASGTFTGNGTGITYTPTIDARNRPFITGFSNQTQYYWVKITDDDGLEVYSDRAAIVAEWGEEFSMGKPLGKKVAKKHYIVETHAYMPLYAAEPGLKDNPRNALPFKAGNHGDQYLIPMTFPPGFNIKDYSVVTCQALFFLADGRPWIQNWTQGDFGFADAAGDRLVLWYNLTNDNATRGLDGTGNEPANSGLDVAPGNLIVQPAGTKAIKRLPPFAGKDDYGRDKPATGDKDAQGWFTPYIEIVELRFEGPKR